MKKEKKINNLIEKPLVSVIIPAYNAEKYVEQAIRSIMNQTYKNLEILVTDDSSTDNTLKILQKLAEEDSRISIHHNEQNKKIVKTLNDLVGRAKGKYIARMDADDISLPKRIEKQVLFLENNKAIDFCGTNAWHINETGVTIGKTQLPLTAEDNRFYLKFYSTFYHPTIMIRSDVYKNNLYSENFLYAEDYELWCRFVFQQNRNGANLEEYLFNYRIFRNQSSGKHFCEQTNASAKIFDIYEIVDSNELSFHKNTFFEHNKKIKNEIIYIKKAYKELISKPFLYSYPAIKKLMFHLYKEYKKYYLLQFCIKKYGLRTFIKIILEK